jgi:hypothetical protein
MGLATNGLNNQGGFTVICDYNTRSCSSANQPYRIWYSTVYVNTSYGDGFGYFTLRYTWGHELGHSMGLWHNSTDSNAIMWPNLYGTIGTPDNSDIGAEPGCSNGGHGLRCIYGG